MEFFATCPAGFETLLGEELSSIGIAHVRPLRGQVSFDGTLADAYRACLWSRLASRIVAVLARGGARNADELYETLAAVPWEQHLAPGATFAFDAHGTNDQLRNTQFVALRAKDALVDRMLARTGARPIAKPAQPDLSIAVRVSRERVTAGIDLAGEPLFRRGYEAPHGSRKTVVPLRPDYAAALLAAGGWPQLAGDATPTLVCPFSGAGTIAVEAAAWALDHAPGLLRRRWGFEGWASHDQAAWETLLEEARERAAVAHEVDLRLDDPRPGCEAAARQALRAAGMNVEPAFGPDALASTTTPALAVCDLSWIEADATATWASATAQVARIAATLTLGSHASVLATSTLTDLVLGDPTTTRQVIIGRDEATIRSYDEPAHDATTPITLSDGCTTHALLAASGQFAARLAKVYRLRRKWAKREDVSCYRIYDSDLPDYAVSIDLFEGSLTPGRWLQVYEYAPPKGIDAAKAQARLIDVMAIAPHVLEVEPANVIVRTRAKARGGSQYADEARTARPNRSRRGGVPLPPGAHLIDEGGLTFEVNFSLRLDCGIFLDHRDTRAMLREMAKQTKGSKRFLNLFAYTGTGTCYAADGGMRHTTTVDLSRPSLDWAQRNMARNGFEGREHEFVQADVIKWVSEQRRTKNRWDLVFCDVPTFSNSSRMGKASFDVQRDHAELLIGVSRLLTREGVCVFSCNLRTFRLDEETLAKAGVVAEDITAKTIPEDFARNPRIHRCYLVRRTPRA